MRKPTTAQVLQRFTKHGIIDPVLAPFDERLITLGYLKWFRNLHKQNRNRHEPQTFDLHTAAQSQRFQAHRFPVAIHATTTSYWAIECARFAVPDGEIGYVTGIEQAVHDVSGSYYPTNVVYWGSPDSVLPDVYNLRWYLTTSYFDGTLPPRYQLFSATAIPFHGLPGSPYPDLPMIDALWYPAHNNRKLKFLVPGGRMLRLYMVSPPLSTYQWVVSARLSGYTQSTYQLAAIRNAREIC